MEKTVETTRTQRFSIRMLGPLSVTRGGANLELPQSRKVRALLAYLVLAQEPVSRSKLCDLLWDGPNDPRGELRWCLSKLRHVLNEPENKRILTSNDAVAISLDDCSVDTFELTSAAASGFGEQDIETLADLTATGWGEFLEDVQIDRNHRFYNWLAAQRRRFQAMQIELLEQLVTRLPPDDGRAIAALEKWIDLSPFDLRAHQALLAALMSRGRIQAGEEHLAATSRLFQSEGLDASSLRAYWRTLHGPAALPAQSRDAPMDAALPTEDASAATRKRVSLAVMPFETRGLQPAFRGSLADGLTHDVITRLAKLRAFFVIARGSVYALADRGVSPEEAGRQLNVDYVATGTIDRANGQTLVRVELVDVPTSRIIWADVFEPHDEDPFPVLEAIGNAIVSAISTEIENTERDRAILKAPNSLNAWEAYHRGLWHMYRFTREENEQAGHFFDMAIKLDPTFARAHAGVSFTHWQNAFQQWGDSDRETGLAYEAASRSVLIDDHDPAAHWAIGRALWLRGEGAQSVSELQRAVDLSPNFALGHYALAFVHSQSGDPLSAIVSADQSRQLSPFDPLMFGMLGARAMAHVRRGEYAEAAEWALKAAARPNAHIIIMAIAALCLGLAGRVEEGRAFVALIRQSRPNYALDSFLASFRFSPDAAERFREGAALIGLS